MTREEAIKCLDMFLHKQCDLERTKFAYDANTIWDAVKIAYDALSEQQWIPCSEELPEPKINPNTMDFERVLCSTAFGDVRAYEYGRPEGFDNAHFWNGAGIMDTYVKAWMPLPEPYKGDV